MTPFLAPSVLAFAILITNMATNPECYNRQSAIYRAHSHNVYKMPIETIYAAGTLKFIYDDGTIVNSNNDGSIVIYNRCLTDSEIKNITK